VPKPLWEKKIRADDRNRIPLGLRCMLVEHDDGPVLIDTGIGNKESEKFKSIYGVENTGNSGPTQLEDALLEVGFKPGDIRLVINTHLHFDHAGGNTYLETVEPPSRRTAEPPIKVSFPSATYVVQEGELTYATRTNERTAASYFNHNWDPLQAAGLLKVVRGEVEIVPGIWVLPTPGHVPYHQSVIVQDGAEVACFLADVMPTTAHVPLPWIMGYDVEPLVTLESKRRLESRAHAERWQLVFEHEPDPAQALGGLQQDGKSFIYQRLDTP